MLIFGKRCALIAAAFALAIGCPVATAQAQGLSKPDPSAPLYARLPEKVKERGYIVSATTGRYPPYNFRTEDGSGLQGVAIELGEEMSKVLGVPIRTEVAESVASFITGVSSGRYDFVLGPLSDTVERQQSIDIVAWTHQASAFLVKGGNPTGIKSIADTCGQRIAIQKASHNERALLKQSELCKAEGKPAVDIHILPDQAAMALAIKSDRTDASFASNAALVYLASQSKGEFEVVGAGDNLMGTIWQGGATPKGSELTAVILEAWGMMFESGAYEKLMTKWNLQGDMQDEPRLNAATE